MEQQQATVEVRRERRVWFEPKTWEWVVEFPSGEVARSTNLSAIEALLDYADNQREQSQ